MIACAILYERTREAPFIRGTLSLRRFSDLRAGRENYGAKLRNLPPLKNSEFISLSASPPAEAGRMWAQGKSALGGQYLKGDDKVVMLNMRLYPADWPWFGHLLEKLEISDVALAVVHAGEIALLGGRWGGGAEEMEGAETAVIADDSGRFIDLGRADDALRLMFSHFSLRHFNAIRPGRTGYFLKRSSNAAKARAEFDHLSSLPAAMRPFYPAVGDFFEDEAGAGYEIEIIPALDIAVLLINGRFRRPLTAAAFLRALEAYLKARPLKKCRPSEYGAKMRALFLDKTAERLKILARMPVAASLDLTCRTHGFDSLEDFAAEHRGLIEKILAGESGDELVFSHGDLFFSNILFDPLSEKIKLVDPKGGSGEEAFLPFWYDLAKLSHSFLGRYDLLVHGEFSIVMGDDLALQVRTAEAPGADELRERFLDFLRGLGLDLRKTRLFEASLFLSMLPLHADSPARMQAQLLRALEIFRDMAAPSLKARTKI